MMSRCMWLGVLLSCGAACADEYPEGTPTFDAPTPTEYGCWISPRKDCYLSVERNGDVTYCESLEPVLGTGTQHGAILAVYQARSGLALIGLKYAGGDLHLDLGCDEFYTSIPPTDAPLPAVWVGLESQLVGIACLNGQWPATCDPSDFRVVIDITNTERRFTLLYTDRRRNGDATIIEFHAGY